MFLNNKFELVWLMITLRKTSTSVPLANDVWVKPRTIPLRVGASTEQLLRASSMLIIGLQMALELFKISSLIFCWISLSEIESSTPENDEQLPRLRILIKNIKNVWIFNSFFDDRNIAVWLVKMTRPWLNKANERLNESQIYMYVYLSQTHTSFKKWNQISLWQYVYLLSQSSLGKFNIRICIFRISIPCKNCITETSGS